MLEDEGLVTSTVPGQCATIDPSSYSRNLDSPSNFFKCLYDADLYNNSGGSSDLHEGGGCGGEKLHQRKASCAKQPVEIQNIKIEPELLSPSPFNGGGGFTYAPQPTFSCHQNGDGSFQQPSTPPMLPPLSNGAQQYWNGQFVVSSSQQSAATVGNSMFAVPDSSTPVNGGNGFCGKSGFQSPGLATERRSSLDNGQLTFNQMLHDETKSPVANGATSLFSVSDSIVPVALCNGSIGDFGHFLGSNHYETAKRDAGSFPSPDSAGGNNSNSTQKTFVPCKVCGDKASGYHYGVTSCEDKYTVIIGTIYYSGTIKPGCKGFFRRSIQKQIEYRCLRDGKCMVFRLNRNRCQYCRFKKCLAVGMSRDSVRYGRVPKRSRDRMQDDARVTSMTGDSEQDAEIERKQLALYDIILSVSQAHHSNCAYTEDKIKNLGQRPMNFALERCVGNENDPVGSTDLLEQQKIVMWEALATHTTSEIQRVVEFAKRIPGFTELMQDDQLILIKAGFFEVWLVRITRMFNTQLGTVTLSDGQFITRDQLDLIYHPELVSLMQAFAISFNNLHLNDGEVGLFTAVVLLTADRPGLNDTKGVERLQEKLIEALKLQLSRSHSSDPQVFPNLLLKLSELRSLGAKNNDVLGWYRMNWRRLKLPPLYAEIYDIPKGEENFLDQSNAFVNSNGSTVQCGNVVPLSPASTPHTPFSMLHDIPPAYSNLSNGTISAHHAMMSVVGGVNGSTYA